MSRKTSLALALVALALAVPAALQDDDDDDDLTGWNVAGPEPGERGAAVIAGHVDSRTGPAVFHGLRDLKPGARIHVDRGQERRSYRDNLVIFAS
ncbi:sortase domain-containing protein [Nonomuraea dietziae]|uniref:sortase domain-containing protein n=1 Tax=Nonomuraea dietziae TaxID=65515 RepID=UPI0033DECB42